MTARLAVCTACLRLPWRESLALAAGLGFAGVQLMADDVLGDAAAVAAALAAHGLVPVAVCADPVAVADPASAERLAAVLAAARRLGAGVVSAHAGVMHGDRRDDALRRALARIGAQAAAAGIRFAIETGPEPSAVLRRALDDIASPGLGVSFDAANLVMVQGEDALAACRTLAPWIVHVHVKDGEQLQRCDAELVYAAFARGGFAELEAATGALFRETPLGAGRVGWPRLLPAVLAVLAENRVAPWLTIERESAADATAGVAEALAQLRRLIDRLPRSSP